MRDLTIYRLYFTGSSCYQSGKQHTPVAVQVHSTGANNPRLSRYVGPDDGRLGVNPYGNYHNRPGGDVCASAYIGKMADGSVAVYQTLPWDMPSWLSGADDNGNANFMGYVGFEVCEDDQQNEAYFRAAVMEQSVLLTAHLCELFGTTPRAVIRSFAQGKALAVMDHAELHGLRLASNHGDISEWLGVYGLTMDDYRDAVEAAMREGVAVTYIDAADGSSAGSDKDPLYEAEVVCRTYLNLRAGKSANFAALKQMRSGVTVAVLDDSDPDWWLVRYDGVVGYACTHSGQDVYLQRVDAETTPPVDEPDAPQENGDRWDTLTVEEKLDDLNERLKRLEGR